MIKHGYRIGSCRETSSNGFLADVNRIGSVGLLAISDAIKCVVFVELKSITCKTVCNIGLVVHVVGDPPLSVGNNAYNIILLLLLDKFFTGKWNNQQEE